ncbi:hypothetical protein COBT_000088 [Conglomerata obtusa]
MTNLLEDTRIQYKSYIPGKVIINGGYLVLKGHECLAITPNYHSCVETTKIKSENPKISIKTNFENEATFTLQGIDLIYNKSPEPSMMYVYNIIKTFYEITSTCLNMDITIYFKLHQTLFSVANDTIEASVKTGFGSSCVFLIGLVDALLENKLPRDEHLNLCMNINKKLSPDSSGCDVFACFAGSMVFKKHSYKLINIPENLVMIMGSFNRSTNTRIMLQQVVRDTRWDKLGTLNSKIISQLECLSNSNKFEIKDLYKEYLYILHCISPNIVPEPQFKILQNTFNFDIFGCGTSGSGGEDCVWCLVEKNNLEPIKKYWDENFFFTMILDDLNGMSKLYNIK